MRELQYILQRVGQILHDEVKTKLHHEANMEKSTFVAAGEKPLNFNHSSTSSFNPLD
jgi:hypothetical protein